jgi:hypothetical protein
MHQREESKDQNYDEAISEATDYRASIQQPNSEPIPPVLLIIELQNLHGTRKCLDNA